MHTSAWQPNSWRAKPPSSQMIAYDNPTAAEEIERQLAVLPPLVTPVEIKRLQHQLAAASRGQRFVLQGGDCAESFADCKAPIITNKLKILLQMSLILLHGLRKPITRVGRIAGQYAKPRSSAIETKDNQTLPSYRGDLINAAPFATDARRPDPNRLLTAYHLSALTLNYIRALIESGFADLHHPENWQLDFVKHAESASAYQRIADNIAHTLDLIKLIPGTEAAIELNRIEFYTAHEALHLPYEQCLTRQEADGCWYNLGTHYPWIGKRTAELSGAHVEYARGIANPIAVKIGLDMTPGELNALIRHLNPDNHPGRLTLTHRFGKDHLADALPPLIESVTSAGHDVLWICDPMHGNTESTADGIKTRHFENILSELQQAFDIHQQLGSVLGGVHFELTGDNVTECLGGARGLAAEDLPRAYKSLVDPRLNYEQALEMAMRITGQTASAGMG